MKIDFCAAAVCGRHHRKNGIPCQDYALARREGGTCVLVLADGAGSLRCSHIGAKAAAEATADLLCGEFSLLAALPEEELRHRLAEAVRDALQKTGLPFSDLGSTLLFYACREGAFLSGHLGDGLIAGMDGEAAAVLSPPENGAFPNETYLTTSPDMRGHLRLYRGNQAERGGAVLLTSDGGAELLLDKRAGVLSPAFGRLAEWTRTYPPEEMEEILQGNLEEVFLPKANDDISIAILTWDGKEEGENHDGTGI